MRPALLALVVGLVTAGALVASSTPRPVPVKPAADTGPWVAIGAPSLGFPEPSSCATSCPISASVSILKPNATRRALSIQNVGAGDLFCCLGAACASSSYDVLVSPLEIATFPGPTLWGGELSCAGAGAGTTASISALILTPAAVPAP